MADDTYGPMKVSDFRLPKTVYLWLFLLVFAVLAPYGLNQIAPPVEKVRPGREPVLSSTAFETYVTAEQQALSILSVDTLMRRATLGALGADRQSGGRNLGKERDDALREALKSYRRLMLEQPDAPNLPRRILLLEHVAGKPLDPDLQTPNNALRRALAARKTPPADIDAELRLWTSLYGNGPKPDVVDGERRIRAMNLRYLQDRALVDLYRAAGDKTKAEDFQKAFDRVVMVKWLKSLSLSLLIGLGFLSGLAFLFFTLRFVILRRWDDIKLVPAMPARTGYGDLLDVGVFYIAVLEVWRLVASLLAPLVLHSPSVTDVVMANGVIYLASALVACAYLLARLRARGATLADIGLRAAGSWLIEVAYGIAGYCTMLPLVLGLGALSHWIFRHNTNLTPNPILPLLVSEKDIVGRIVIFLLVAIAAPLFEELFFRGVLFTGLRRRYGWVLSGFLSAIVFAVLHPMADWLSILGMGFAFAAMRESRQSLIPSMTAHFLQNSFSFVSLSLLFSS